ncbi:MAG: winged helix-turn-helix domain-containing protein, partial [Cyanobacteria bacterium 0813]|nr:winged helix-turn-helix domain-containing protein [Cyanobacteria bacterium 0813]
LLQDVDQAQLWQLVQQPAPDGGLWNGRKVADWLSEKMGFQVSHQRGWQYLQQIGFRLKIPRPSHSDSDFHNKFFSGKKTLSRVSFASK